MLAFQTLSCLSEIPVVRSSTNIIQNLYTKAKDTSVLVRVPCIVAETVADKSLKFALAVATPLVKPLNGPVRVIDTYAAQKIRQIESKYPAITTPTEDVVHTLTEKAEPVRHVINSVKDTTTATIQHGRETISNVASVTVNKASNVADSMYTYYGNRGPGKKRGANASQSGLLASTFSTVGYLCNSVFQATESSLIWSRMLLLYIVLKVKQTNDIILTITQRSPLSNGLTQRLLIIHGAFLDYISTRVAPDDRTLTDLKKSSQKARPYQPAPLFQNRPSLRPDPSATVRQNVITTREETVVSHTNGSYVPSRPQPAQPDYSNMTDTEELYARLAAANNQPMSNNVHVDDGNNEMNDGPTYNNDIARLHDRIHPTDIELLHSRLPTDVVVNPDHDQPLTADQQTLHARIIAAELENQGYPVDGNDN